MKPGLRSFATLWLGQIVSLFGSALTSFGLGVWVLERTGSVTQFGLIALFATLPNILLGPLAGAAVDRRSYRRTLVESDAAAAAATAVLLVLALSGRLETWHIYPAVLLQSSAGAFQWPAFGALTPQLVPKKHLTRASGTVQTAASLSMILAPMLGGLLLVRAGLVSLLLIDLATFAVAVASVLAARLPDGPAARGSGSAPRLTLWAGAHEGWRYVRQRRGLLLLLLVFAAFNFGTGLVNLLIPPIVLGFSGPAVLGTVLSAGSFGTLFGGVFVTAWGGPARRVPAILTAFGLGAAMLAVMGARPDPVVIGVGLFGYLFSIPVAQSLSHAVWFTKVPAGLQGRVISIRRAVAGLASPAAYVLGGPLVDRLLDPLLMPSGGLASSVGRLLGAGPGRGAALLLILTAAGVGVILLLARRTPELWWLDERLVDVPGPD